MDFALLFIVVLVFPLYTIEQSTNVSVYGRSNSTIILNSTLTRDGNPIQWRFNTLQYTRDLKINPYLPNDTRNRLTVVNNYDLRITNLQTEDEGKYTCSTNYMGSLRIHTVNLALLKQPTLLAFQNASIVNKLIGTEGQDLLIECIAVGGQPAPALSLVVLGTTVQTGVQELRYILRNIPRIYDTTNVSCEANSDALDIPMTTTALIYLTLMPLMPMLSAPFVNTLEMVPFSISCTSTGSRPAAAIWWMIGQTDVTITGSSQENKVVDETFTVTSTLTYMVGRKFNLQPIICTANNTIGGFSNQINLFVRSPLKQESVSSGKIIGAVCGSLISLIVLMVILVFVIIKKRKGHRQGETTVKFEKSDSDDHTHSYEEVQYSSGTQRGSNKNRDQSTTKHYEALGLQDVPNAYENLSNEAPRANRDLSPSRNYEKLGLKDAPNVYEDLTDKDSNEIGGQSTTIHYDALGQKEAPNVYNELTNEAHYENRSQSFGKHYEDLGRKNAAYVYDVLKSDACEETTANSPTIHYEELGVKNNPTVYDDLINEDAENKVYEHDSNQ